MSPKKGETKHSLIFVPHPSGFALGGGIYLARGAATLSNCLVSLNSASIEPDINGSYAAVNDLVTDGNPLLAPLGNYGGPTPTMPPLPGSPAIDAGIATGLTTDQRGFPRPLGLAPDIGAVEGVYNNGGVGQLTGMTLLGNGSTRFHFTNYTDTSYTVFASSNLTLPFSTWTNLGPAVESPAGSGQFQFTDPQATNYPQRFYRVRSP